MTPNCSFDILYECLKSFLIFFDAEQFVRGVLNTFLEVFEAEPFIQGVHEEFFLLTPNRSFEDFLFKCFIRLFSAIFRVLDAGPFVRGVLEEFFVRF